MNPTPTRKPAPKWRLAIYAIAIAIIFCYIGARTGEDHFYSLAPFVGGFIFLVGCGLNWASVNFRLDAHERKPFPKWAFWLGGAIVAINAIVTIVEVFE